MTNIFKLIYIRSTGYSYTNMGRLFLRLFVGVMLMQFDCVSFITLPRARPTSLPHWAWMPSRV